MKITMGFVIFVSGNSTEKLGNVQYDAACGTGTCTSLQIYKKNTGLEEHFLPKLEQCYSARQMCYLYNMKAPN